MRIKYFVAALVAALAAFVMVAACEETTEVKQQAKERTQGKERSAKGARIGQPVKDGKFTFVVTKVRSRTDSIGPEGLAEPPQGKFVLVSMKVTNHGDEAQTLDASSQKLLAGGKEYSADSDLPAAVEYSESFYNEINPGNSVNGAVVFDVPRDLRASAVELHDSPFSGGVRVSLR
jgi:Domain of unknown function (DUF4352)